MNRTNRQGNDPGNNNRRLEETVIALWTTPKSYHRWRLLARQGVASRLSGQAQKPSRARRKGAAYITASPPGAFLRGNEGLGRIAFIRGGGLYFQTRQNDSQVAPAAKPLVYAVLLAWDVGSNATECRGVGNF